MTPDELRAIRERCEAATPGPWTYDEECGYIEVPPCGTIEFKPSWTRSVHFLARVHNNFVEGEDGLGFDGAFIAAARTDVPALLDEVERLCARITEHQRKFEAGWDVLRKQRDEARAEVERLTWERDEARANYDTAASVNAWHDQQRAKAERERDEARRIANDAVRELNRANVYAWLEPEEPTP